MIVLISYLQLDMERAVQIAKENSFQVLQTHIREKSLMAGIMEARSGFYPTLKLQGIYTFNANPAEIVMAFPTRYLGFPNYQTPDPNDLIVIPDTSSMIYDTIPFRPRHSFNFQATLQQPLFTWFRNLNAYRMAKHQLEIYDLQREQTLYTVEYNVRSFYLELLMMKGLVSLKRRTYEDLKATYESAKERYEKGLISRLEFMQAEVEMENARYDYENTLKAYRDMKDNLKLLLNLPPEEEIELVDSLEGVEADTTILTRAQEMLEERYDIRILKEQKRSLKYLLSIQKSANKPMIVGQANYTFSSPAPNLKDEWGSTWTLSIVGMWNVFDGFKSRAEVKKTEAQMEQMDLTIQFARKRASLELRGAMRDVDIARESLKRMEKNLRLAKTMFESAKEQYEKGLIPYLKFRDIQRAYISARIGYDMALKDYKKALLEVWRVVRIGGEGNGR